MKITPTGTVKVLDFGLAKILAEPEYDQNTRSAVTAPAVLIGTPAYMAPEQVQGRSIDRRVDVWAFGVLLYEMVTGERPFRGESVQERFAAVLTVDPDWAPVSPAVRALLRACLERDPLKRLRDIADYRFLLAPSDAAPRARPAVDPAFIVDHHRGNCERGPRVLRREIAHTARGRFSAGGFDSALDNASGRSERHARTGLHIFGCRLAGRPDVGYRSQ